MTAPKKAPPSRARRQAAFMAGQWGESMAALLLRVKGYRVLARRYRSPVGEIDLIARRGRLVIFVEVKRRNSLAEAAEAITAHQRQRVARAAGAYLQAHPQLARLDQRFDAILLVPGRLPRHVIGAWHES